MLNLRIIWVVWLLCISITSATLDNVPDPPAIKQRAAQSQSFDFSEQLQQAVADARQAAIADTGSQRPLFWRTADRNNGQPGAVGDTPLLRQAADPSPPRVL